MSLEDAYRAINNGDHEDPFSILGEHDGFVTVYAPHVERLLILEEGETSPIDMRRNPDEPDFFTATITPQAPYGLVGQKDGAQWEFQDPYRFNPVIGDIDLYLVAEGTHQRLWQVFGAHIITHQGTEGVHFAVWAPNARRVSLVGDFNFWNGRRHLMRPIGQGVWELFIPGLTEGVHYKYEIRSQSGDILPLKADPVGFGSEHPPQTASVVRDLTNYTWNDQSWLTTRSEINRFDQPISIYEVHLGSWRRKIEDNNRPLSYLELAEELVDYAVSMGFTHIELLPISEFPFNGSWGYQPIGLYAPTIRFGTNDEFRTLIDRAHQKGLGVLLDWVPGHFPSDEHGLMKFDGTHLYEHADSKEGFHQDWNTLIYNYGRREVANYLIANACYWLEEYHIDGLRVDAVASMLYRDYSRKDGAWIPNKDGGRENYEAIAFLQNMNHRVYEHDDSIMTAAEESTSFPMVSHPVDKGGLGFGFKWNMGWMNDTLSYMEEDSIHRKHHHHKMTFGLHYAFTENFILPLSHDEVVHGKGSILTKMSGNYYEKFANVRAYYGFMFAHPGKKLLFMGLEFAQEREWNYNRSLDWHLLSNNLHQGVQDLVRDLNSLYRKSSPLYRYDSEPRGFEWLELNDDEQSIFAFIRKGDGNEHIVAISNFTPIDRVNYRLGFPSDSEYIEVLNTDSQHYGGENRGNLGKVTPQDTPWHNQDYSAKITVPGLSTLFFKPTTAIGAM